jgi:hypothetical protein
MPPDGGNLRLFAVPHRVLDGQPIGNVLDFQAELAIRPTPVADKYFFINFRRKLRKIYGNWDR